MRKKLWIFVVAVCLVAGLAGWATGKAVASRQPKGYTFYLSHNALTVDVDNVLARLLVTYTGDGVLTWSSSDPNIVEVDQHGFIRGVAPGRAYITCSDGDWNSQCVVTVVQKLEDYTLMGPASIELRPGQRQQMQYTYTGSGKLAYTTNDPKIAVFEKGVLVAKAPGQAILTCTDGVRTTQTVVTVRGWLG